METFAICTMAIARATRAPTPERIATLEQAIERLHRLARNALRPFLLSLSAELCRRVGMIQRGLALLDEADGTIYQTMERWAEAEGRQVRGRLLADSGAIGIAETCFRDAIAIAESQAAESWRIRAATDLVQRCCVAATVRTTRMRPLRQRSTRKAPPLRRLGRGKLLTCFRQLMPEERDGAGTDRRVEVPVH